MEYFGKKFEEKFEEKSACHLCARSKTLPIFSVAQPGPYPKALPIFSVAQSALR